MKFNFKEILEGVKNSIFVTEEVEKVAAFRYDICKGCPKISTASDDSQKGPYYTLLRPDEHCTMCACNIHAKVRSLSTSCPIGKWQPVLNKDEEEKVSEYLNKQN